jgi:carbon monoxide dehydrogenase subunit G
MKISGKHIAQASTAQVWHMLMNTKSLSKIIPGVSSLEKTNENTFKSSLEIKIGPINDSFTGSLQMEKVDPEKGFTLNVQQNGKIGNAKGNIEIGFSQLGENQTTVCFDGDIKLSGMMVVFGSRVLGGISDTITRQFFANLDDELSKSISIS